MNLSNYSTIFKKKSIQFLLNGFKKKFKKMSMYNFRIIKIRTKKKKTPKAMIISFCNSRVSVERIFSSKHGELFTHKNIENLVPAYKNKSLNCSTAAVLKYGNLILEAPAIIILRHLQYRGIKAYSDIKCGLDENELNLPFARKCFKALKPCFLKKLILKDIKPTVKYLVKEAYIESLKNLKKYQFIKETVKNKKLIISNFFFNIKNGELFFLNEENKDFIK